MSFWLECGGPGGEGGLSAWVRSWIFGMGGFIHHQTYLSTNTPAPSVPAQHREMLGTQKQPEEPKPGPISQEPLIGRTHCFVLVSAYHGSAVLV